MENETSIFDDFECFQLPPYSLLVMNIMRNLVLLTVGRRSKVSDYYKKQERLLEGFTEMETMAENGGMPGSLTEVGCVQLDDFEWQLVEQSRRIISHFWPYEIVNEKFTMSSQFKIFLVS